MSGAIHRIHTDDGIADTIVQWSAAAAPPKVLT